MSKIRSMATETNGPDLSHSETKMLIPRLTIISRTNPITSTAMVRATMNLEVLPVSAATRTTKGFANQTTKGHVNEQQVTVITRMEEKMQKTESNQFPKVNGLVMAN